MNRLLTKGEEIYHSNCAACHQTDSLGLKGSFPPIAASPVVVGPVTKLVKNVLYGVSGTPMASFSTQLSDTEIASVLTFLRNSFGNGMGGSIQPSMVNVLRK